MGPPTFWTETGRGGISHFLDSWQGPRFLITGKSGWPQITAEVSAVSMEFVWSRTRYLPDGLRVRPRTVSSPFCSAAFILRGLSTVQEQYVPATEN